MAAATLTSKGQITIPKEIRDALGLESGDRVAFRLREDGVVEIHLETLDLTSLHGILKSKKRGVSLDDMDRDVAREAAGE
ncbi:MAG: AbrB/MazE/SpoVT family DNA-binding domain-containing protein [Deltaproteobacteria bacterium]|nr:AbrB/MazE/SpoVT family DNA-binding domain-containing protein [Deltaproteobacteria bacterium]MBW1871906.1 AbrB/MazE/SpoVT family DNA-binding domain-containing protein [Deltaproteobacteria bacterium]